MADLTRRSLLIQLGAAAVVVGTTSRILAQQQDVLIRGEVRKFHSMSPGVASITGKRGDISTWCEDEQGNAELDDM